MPYPTVPRSIGVKILVAGFWILLTPFIIADLAVVVVFLLVYMIVTLPWVLVFYSSNRGLLERDQQTGMIYAEQAERTNMTVNRLVQQVRAGRGVPNNVRFFPHESEYDCACVPGVAMVESTAYRYPVFSLVLMLMADAGWRRGHIYDVFIQVLDDAEGREKITEIKRKVCRGNIAIDPKFFVAPFIPLVKRVEAQPNLWKADRSVVDVDMNDAKWILAEGALIRPRDRDTLIALDKLNMSLGMWKWVTKVEELKEPGYWQYIVL
jgi:hypothetical protein